ncbi:sugar porter family MFS transporter [Asticcacaulis machinosus]|uniref:Sugar porter family MFS transporter n=1 Tax=Asticcacaulis machinosus TaxID=2984211 RepID=A0ABT5HLZ7_9CAUL|nr:sugar porter family MFS transporter [Asticcacaulis machinosus]MDC7677271.1 sugar porter family MFS transporter [Asticcacaulis machinosus]
MAVIMGGSGGGDPVTPGRLNIGYIWVISAIAALGGLLFGYDWVVVGGAKPFYEAYFGLTSEVLVGWANSCALLGCLAGSILAGFMSDRFGRKPLLILSAILFASSSILTGWATSFDAFIIWRIVGGVAIGVVSNVSPTYIAEISPPAWRGRLVTLNQLTLVVGILAAQIVNLLIAGSGTEATSHEAIRATWAGEYGWRWMFTAVAVPSIVFLVCALFVPESPRWLVKAGAIDKAKAVFARIGDDTYAQAQVNDAVHNLSQNSARVSWRELFRPALLAVLMMGIGLAVLQQWSGTNVIFNYAEEIYRGAGYDLSGIMFNIVITGAINLIFTLVATAFVDRAGRRALMLWGAGGMALIHGCLGLAFFMNITGVVVLGLTLAVIALYAMSLAPITWVLLSEIFPTRIRGLAMSISVSALWIACFAVTFTFPIMNAALGASGTFWCYGLICLFGFFLIRKFVPETKGRSLEEIEAQLGVSKGA